MSRMVAVGIVFFAIAVVGWAGSDTAKKLIGTWELTKGEGPKGAMFEFTKDGKMIMRIKQGEKEFKIEGTYELKEESLTTKLGSGGKSKSETSKVKKVTEKELVLEDEKGKLK